MKSMLSIREVSKSFTGRGCVLDRLSFEITAGETVAITGPSGSGKTTLLNILGLLDMPDSGSVFFRGIPVSNYSPEEAAAYRNRDVGFVFQDHLLLNYLTVEENIRLPLMASGKNQSDPRDTDKYINELMEKTGISGLSGKYPFQISGGEAQRVALVRALANKPSMLLADEPTGSLDAGNARSLATLLMEMNRNLGVTLILATHSMELAEKMAINIKLA